MSDELGAAAIGEAQCRLAGEARELRSRDVDDLVETLGAVLELWRDPRSTWRAELERALPAATGFSPQVVSAGLALGLEGWDAAALRSLVASELGRFSPYAPTRDARAHASGFDTTAVVLAGSIPMPTMLALLLPLLLRSPVLAKPSSADPVTARLFARSVASVDAQLGRCIEVAEFRRTDREAAASFLKSPCVVAYGSDETMAAVAAQTNAAQRVVAYGHRLSIAAIGEEALDPKALGEVADALALDIALWDQLGCLSPTAVYVVDSSGEQAARVAERLAEALADIEARLPRGEVAVEARAAIAHERAEAELRAAAGRPVAVHAGAELAYSVVLEADGAWRGTPLHRFVRVHPVASQSVCLANLRPLAAHLAAVAVAGFGAGRAAFARELGALGASRVCRPGALQAPPLDWHHDGLSPLLPLARITDVAFER